MDQNPTERLFQRFAVDGDAEALAEVFDRCAAEVLGVARHLTADIAAAEDLLQATFLSAMW